MDLYDLVMSSMCHQPTVTFFFSNEISYLELQLEKQKKEDTCL